jgi:site-specific DNA recombinase
LKELLQDIRDGKIHCVLAYKIDRLTRSVRDFHVLMDQFDRNGVKFVSITQSLDTHHPMGRLLRNILLDFAQFEREMTADRTRDKMQQRASKGLWNGGNVPYGYHNQDKRLVLHPIEAERVRFMFHQYAQNPSVARLRQELYLRGWYPRSGKYWGKMTVSYILANPIYCGKVKFNGERHEGEHDALIDEALYHKVQSLQPERTRVITRIERVFLLKGLLKCSICESFMTPHYTQKRRKDGSVNRIAYYRCTKTMHQSTKVCTINSMNAAHIEKQVADYLMRLCQDSSFVDLTIQELNRDQEEKLKPLQQEEIRLRARLDEVEREVERFVRALGQGTILVKRLEREILQREKDKEAIQVQYDSVQQKLREHAARDYDSEIVLKSLQDFGKVFDALARQEQAEVLRCLIRDIVAYPDKLLMNIFELAQLTPGSQKRKDWLPGQDSNLRPAG